MTEPSTTGESPFATRMADLARHISSGDEFTSENAAHETLSLVMAATPQVRWATFTELHGRREAPRTPAWTAAVGLKLDLAQYEHRQGPCLDALSTGIPVLVIDLASEDRWPEFAAYARCETPARSAMSYSLASTGNPHLALNLYGDEPAAFTSADSALLTTATAAGFAMTAIATRRRADNLAAAMASNRDIGTAMGMLMARHSWTSEEAFNAIRRRSQREHRKVRDVAADVLQHGQLADAEQSAL